MPRTPITVRTTVNAPIERVWAAWTEPRHITGWSFASDDWEALDPENDLRPGGAFKTTLAAKDKSASFDFAGVYSQVEPHSLIAYTLGDGRDVRIEFVPVPDGVAVTETFDAEETHTEEQQRAGWQAFLDNFKRYTESL